jgi:hypothetical protein
MLGFRKLFGFLESLLIYLVPDNSLELLLS